MEIVINQALETVKDGKFVAIYYGEKDGFTLSTKDSKEYGNKYTITRGQH